MSRFWIGTSAVLLAISTAGGLSHWLGNKEPGADQQRGGAGSWLWFARGNSETAPQAPLSVRETVIEGQVFAQTGGELSGGLAGVEISLPDFQLQTTTDSTGHYQIVIPGETMRTRAGAVVAIAARKPGHTRYDGEIRLIPGRIEHKFSMRAVQPLANPVGKYKWLNRE